MISRLGATLLIAFLISSCASDGNNRGLATLIGGATGALVGSQVGKGSGRIAGVAIGAAVGSLVGYGIGKYLDSQDQHQLAEATAKTADTGQPQRIHSDESGATIRTTPVTTTTPSNAPNCRVVRQSVELKDGRQESEDVRLCKGPNGWEAA